jgi:nucleoside 2-deoxyribosyltransferase
MEKIFIIGSVKREKDIERIANLIASLGFEVDHVKRQPDKTTGELIMEAFHRIAEADKIVATVNEFGTIGDGTLYELTFAQYLGKKTGIFEESGKIGYVRNLGEPEPEPKSTCVYETRKE